MTTLEVHRLRIISPWIVLVFAIIYFPKIRTPPTQKGRTKKLKYMLFCERTTRGEFFRRMLILQYLYYHSLISTFLEFFNS